MMQIQEYIDLVKILADESAKVILPSFANPDVEVDTKADQSPVTIADREAEKVIRRLIGKKYPRHGIVGEEFGRENDSAEFVWMLDPIDGTKTFIRGCPLFGTLISLLHQGQPVLGAINLPALGKLCIGDNRTTTVNGRPVRMRHTADLSQATLLATDIDSIARYQSKEKFGTLMTQTKFFRTWGDCYGYFLLAGGWADIMLDPVMNPWDLLPLIPVIRGAGGIISDWQGGNAAAGKSCVASFPALHEQVIRLLND